MFEIVDIWTAADALGYPFGPVVKLLILTATRREEVGAIGIGELTLPIGATEGCWTIPAQRSKNGRALRVPLVAMARTIVEAARLERPAASPFLFSTTARSSVSGWSKPSAGLTT